MILIAHLLYLEKSIQYIQPRIATTGGTELQDHVDCRLRHRVPQQVSTSAKRNDDLTGTNAVANSRPPSEPAICFTKRLIRFTK